MENYRNVDQTSREYHEIAENWIKSGITPDKHLAFYCGTGWRGSEAWFNAWLMGWPRVSVYDGGWFEWSSDPDNPVETGIPEHYQIPGYKMNDPESLTRTDTPVEITDFLIHEGEKEVVSEILKGLSSPQKYISSRFFYDDNGSALFEAITRLPEYYPTRTEKSILKAAAPRIVNGLSVKNIVELGSGDCSKISILLEAMPGNHIERLVYLPVDVCKTTILNSARMLSKKYPGIRIHGILSDFMKHFNVIPGNGNKLICFFGSTLGNLTGKEETSFLLNLRSRMNPGDQLLIGFDMVKDIRILEKAYNDEQGTTAAFNKNILRVVNHHAKTNLNPDQFDHYSFYNVAHARIEMHLRALADIEVTSPYLNNSIFLKKGETIHTENSHKYDRDCIHRLAGITGLQIKDI
ncbi:MAG: L-histidine N(alpha)-methyltransferase [Bacteroidales bacterium]|jgi:L-histidine N-alpha-methyltransferase|nr:L-histidine N(alpha)-methyltransferase [Bacteroidales bacterium]